MQNFRTFLSFLTGLFLVVVSVLDECPRVGELLIGLLLMGVFTVPEVIGILRKTTRGELEEDD